ncbi:unnamed protein product [Cylicocyclus nassatus]|uniref:Condensin-2 complex subunit G2 n=1 Tax=Cylicocyclus nassatus TaxID=53992 RepID=A0AA36DQH5_CYLNA|nr:unnamed protein product [Cylicocyclus nassatus]
MSRRRKQSDTDAAPLLMEDMDLDENVPSKSSDDDKEADLPKKKVARRNARKKQVPELDVEETEKKSVEEKIEYLLSDYSALLEKACKNEKGQKTLIKRLWSDYEEAVQQCDVNALRHALWEPSFTASTEGIRFCAYALRKIGIRKAFLLMKKMIVAGATNTTCGHLGQVIYVAWRMAVKEEDEETKKQIEVEMITGTLHAAVLLPVNLSAKFMHVLSAFSGTNAEKARVDGMLVRCFDSVLWIGIDSCNDMVRYSASTVLLGFYPLIDEDDFKKDECLYKQHSSMMNMLKDECTPIRTMAAKRVLKILSTFWNFIPRDFIKQYMTFIVDVLSRDSVVAVRLAVYEGMRYLITVPACLNAAEHALKCISLNGINDKNERVRMAAFEMLKLLKGHRYIRFFDVVPMEEVLARLQIETSESVRRQIVPLIFKSFFPDPERVDRNERMKRIAFLIKHGRICALSFHRLLFPLGLVTIKEAVEHIQFMTILVYRSFSKGIAADTTMDSSTSLLLDDTVGTLTGPSQEMSMPDENSPVWKRNKVFLECVVVMWMSMRKALMESRYAAEKQKLDTLETKVFKKMFQCFRTTSLIGTTMLIGSMLPPSSMDGITQSVLSLLNERVVDESVMEPYLEATAQWKIEYLFEIINSGLSILQTHISEPEHSPPSKKKKSPELPPVDRLRKALRYLRYLLRSYTTNQMITCSYLYQLEQFYKKLSMIRHVVDLRLGREVSDVGIPDNLIVEAFEMKQTLTVVLINCKDRGEDDKDHFSRFIVDMCDELKWFESDVLSNLSALYSEDVISFLIRLSQTVLRCIGLTMASWDFTEISESLAASDSHADELVPEDKNYPNICSRVVLAFCSSSTPSALLPTVLTAAKLLLEDGCATFSNLLSVLDYVPKWIISCTSNDENLDEKAIGDAYLTLWRAFLERTEYTEVLLDKSINICAVHLLNYLTQLNEDTHEVQDPRLHDFEVTPAISLLLHRVIFKNKVLITKFMERVGGLSCSDLLYTNDLDGDTCLLRLGSCAQLALLCDLTSQGVRRVGNSTSTVYRTSRKVMDLLAILHDRVENVAKTNPPKDNMVLSQIREMFE